MRFKILGVTRHLILPDAFKRKKIDINGFGYISLEKTGDQLNILNDHLRYELGNAQLNVIKESVCFYTLADVKDEDLIIFERGFTDLCSDFITALWLMKDNSISSDFDLCHIENKKSHFTQRPFINSNSHCEYSDISFSRDEIDDAIDWFHLLTKPNGTPRNEDSLKNRYSVSNGIINMDKDFAYDKTNRFQRALRFVSIARKQTVLQPRITYYISALEALLSNSNVELRMQVADRGARILGTSYEEKLRINKVISIAYSFRSQYIHGAVNSEKSLRKSLKFLGSVEELSEEMDDILRRLIRLFLTELSFVPHLKDEDFSEWIEELLYKNITK